MSRLGALSRATFAWPVERRHRRREAAAASGPPAGDGRAAAEAERLERISVYARAGYFHMGYTFDMYPLVGDLPPE